MECLESLRNVDSEVCFNDKVFFIKIRSDLGKKGNVFFIFRSCMYGPFVGGQACCAAACAAVSIQSVTVSVEFNIHSSFVYKSSAMNITLLEISRF